MSTGCSWEGIRQVRATLLGMRHVLERLCGGHVYLGRYNKCSTFTFFKFKARKWLLFHSPLLFDALLGGTR